MATRGRKPKPTAMKELEGKWYDAVYEPQAEAVDTEDTSHTEEPQG